MPEVVKISIRKTKECLYFSPQGLDLNIGDQCVVETENDLETGEVLEETKIVSGISGELKKAVRKLTPEDMEQIRQNRVKAKEAFDIVQKKIEDRELDMKLVNVSYTFNANKLFVYYTAPERVDFRALVKDLAYFLKTRIEMCQIGVRDETKIFGGYGMCGRCLCCISCLKNFKSVTIDMAKEQNLSLGSSKISGICGRLMCCISYEYEFYHCEKRKLPKIGSRITTPHGSGKLVSVNIFKGELLVEFENGTQKKVSVDEIPVGMFDKFKFKKKIPHKDV